MPGLLYHHLVCWNLWLCWRGTRGWLLNVEGDRVVWGEAFLPLVSPPWRERVDRWSVPPKRYCTGQRAARFLDVASSLSMLGSSAPFLPLASQSSTGCV